MLKSNSAILRAILISAFSISDFVFSGPRIHQRKNGCQAQSCFMNIVHLEKKWKRLAALLEAGVGLALVLAPNLASRLLFRPKPTGTFDRIANDGQEQGVQFRGRRRNQRPLKKPGTTHKVGWGSRTQATDQQNSRWETEMAEQIFVCRHQACRFPRLCAFNSRRPKTGRRPRIHNQS